MHHYKCYGWMDVFRVKLQLYLEYGSVVYLSEMLSKQYIHTKKHNNNLKFVVFGIYI